MLRFVALSLLGLLTCSPLFAQTITPLWEQSFTQARSIVASPDGLEVVVGEGAYGAAAMFFFDALSGNLRATIDGSEGSPVEFAAPEEMIYGPDGETVIVGHKNIHNSGGGGCGGEGGGCGTSGGIDLRRWNPDVAPEADPLVYRLTTPSNSLAANDQALVHAELYAGSLPNLFVRDVETTELIYSEASEKAPIYAEFSPDGNTLVTIHSLTNTPIRIRTAGTWSADTTLDIDAFLLQPTEIAFSPDGSRAVVSTRAYTEGVGVYVYDTSDWSLERYIAMPPRPSESAIESIGKFSDDGDYVVVLRRERGPELSEWAARLYVYRVTTGDLVVSEFVTPFEVFPRVPPADIERIPGTGLFAWHANNRAGVVGMDMEQTVATDDTAPDASALDLAVWPNPAAGSFTTSFQLQNQGDVSLKLYDLLGRAIATVSSGAHAAGLHQARLDTSALANGVYLLRLATPDGAQVQKVVVRH